MPPVAIFHVLSVAAGAEDKVSLHKVNRGMMFRIKRCELLFGADANLDLSLWLMEGELHKLPEKGAYKGNNVKLVVMSEHTWDSDQDVMLHYKNTHATEARTALVNISAEET